MNGRLIIELTRRPLADYAVLMTILALGAALLGTIVLALVDSSYPLSHAVRLSALGAFWFAAMLYLWLHFRRAARRAQLAPSSTGLFYTIQGIALGFAALPMILSRTVGWMFFSVIAFGVEIAVGTFFLCYIFLAATLCGRVPSSSVVGFAAALVGIYFSYQLVLTL